MFTAHTVHYWQGDELVFLSLQICLLAATIY